MAKSRSAQISPLPFDVRTSLEALGQRIAEARQERGMSQREFAAMMGVGPQTVLRIEQGWDTVQIGHYARAIWLLEIRNAPIVTLSLPAFSDDKE